jgi:hypothetical protein
MRQIRVVRQPIRYPPPRPPGPRPPSGRMLLVSGAVNEIDQMQPRGRGFDAASDC